MPPTRHRTYRTREFAQLAGVTVRTLHHYDHIGLLKPKRTLSGYRAYSPTDLERLEQIIALKFIGVPLSRIRLLTKRTPDHLANVLRAQRQTLEEKRHLLDMAIAAIGEVEHAIHAGEDADAALYRRIIEVIEMQSNSKAWKKTYDTLVDAKVGRLTTMSADVRAKLHAEWAELIADIKQSLDDDPAAPKAQALATRWVSLLERVMGGRTDPSLLASAAASPSSGNWSPSVESFADKRVWDFVKEALAARVRRED